MKSKKKKNAAGSSKFVTFLKVFVILAVSALICITTYFVYLAKQAETAANNAYEAGDREQSAKRDEFVSAATDNVSVLFVGIDDSDKREQGSENSRSDALILATLNNKDKSIKLLSIPRDSYVYIPYVGYKDKITHAHSYGGTRASIDTIEELLDIPIDYYVRMNFNAFIDVVDAIGGVEVEVPYDILEKDENDQRTVQLFKGIHTLNGREALAFARTRKADSDFERGKRQQEILKAIINKTASVSAITKYDDVIKAVGDNMRTNMEFDEMKSFIAYLTKGVPSIETMSLEGHDSWEGGYYYILDNYSVQQVSDALKAHLGLTKSYTDSTSDSDSEESGASNSSQAESYTDNSSSSY